MRILIVDDNEDSRMILRKTLESAGHEVDAASDGAEALKIAKKAPYNIIISDILMPGMDGFRFCREIKNDEELKSIPFIFYTASYRDPEDERLGMSLGASRYIYKPVETAEFLGMVDEVLQEYKENRLPVPENPIKEGTELFRMYNESIIKKLDEKVQTLDRERRFLSTIFESIAEGIIVIDKDHRIVEADKAACEEAGKSKEEIIGTLCYQIIFGSNESCRSTGSTCPLDKVFKTGEVVKFTHVYHRDGKVRHVNITVSPIKDASGKVIQVVEVFKDMTEEKQLQAQLLQAQKMEAIGILAGGIAHDFNNFLTAILGYTEITMNRFSETDPAYRNLKQVQRASLSAADLTQQLLIFSRKQPMELTTLNINGIIDNFLKMLKRLIGENITINTELEPEIWTVKADEGNIEQVIMNLAVNARDAMPEGGRLTIMTENVILDEEYCKGIPSAQPGKFVRVMVGDTGAGMDKETIQHIFEPFFSTKGIGKGTGLGLSVVYGIIKEHGGWVDVYSEPGQGSTFKVYLPASSVKSEVKSSERVDIKDIKDLKGSGERILLVEDEEGVRRFATDLLTENGYIIVEAASAEDAMEVFEKEKRRFHLAFVDVILPGKTGLQLVDQLLSLKPELSVLLSSGYTEEQSKLSEIRNRGIRFIQKPYSIRKILQTIREILESKQVYP